MVTQSFPQGALAMVSIPLIGNQWEGIMEHIKLIVLVVTILMASWAARESTHDLRVLLRGWRQAWAIGRMRAVVEIAALGCAAMGHGIYYWLMAALLALDVPIGH